MAYPDDHIYVVDVNFTLQKNPNIYCFAYSIDENIAGQNDVDDLLATFKLNVLPALLPFHDPTVQFDCNVGRKIFPDNIIPSVDVTGDVGGAGVGIALPGQCSMLIQLYNDSAGISSRKRGRDFLTGFQHEDQADGTWQASITDTVLTVYEESVLPILTGPSTNIYSYGIWSATQQAENVNPDFVGNGGTTPNPDTFGDDPFTRVNAVRADPEVKTQRRRQPEDPCKVFRVAPPAP